MQRGAGGEAGTAGVPRVPVNLGVNEDDVNRHYPPTPRSGARSSDQICICAGGSSPAMAGDSTVLAKPNPNRRGIALLGAFRASQRISTQENSRIELANAISARDASLT